MGSTSPPSTTGPASSFVSPTTINGIVHTVDDCSALQSSKPTILHLGDPIQHNHDIYDQLRSQFNIERPAASDLERTAFMRHLKNRTWGNFSAIMRPFWRSGNAMTPWNRELIELLPKSLKVIASAGAGYDWVDVRCLAEHGIIYCNGGDASTESVADMALYHLICVFRHMTVSSLAARARSSARWRTAHDDVPAISHNPRNRTLGIIGLGNIGFAVAVKVKAALGMKILYNDITRKDHNQEEMVGAIYFEEMEDMLPRCECVLIATPAGPALLTAQTLRLLPRGARIVNIARGSLIDEEALADALDDGHIDAVGLDVHANEPFVNERLAQMENVELTCHTGGGSVETNIGFERLSMQNCEEVLHGRLPFTAVNMQWFKPKMPSSEGDPHVNGYNHDTHDNFEQDDPPAADTQVNRAHAETMDEAHSAVLHTHLETGALSPAEEIHNADHTNGVT